MSRVLIKSDLLTENNKADILEKYVCPKCDGILRDAVQTSCGHWLCNSCAEEIFDKKDTTPYCPRTDCGEELTTEEGRPFFPDRFVRKEINRFYIMCHNRKFGCNWNGKISDFFAEHLNCCAYEEKKRPHKEDFFLSKYHQYLVNQRPIMDYEQARNCIIVQGSCSFGFSSEKSKSDMNVASGCPRFVSMNELLQGGTGGFILGDTIFIKAEVDTATMRNP